jgi:hypothetical protein
LTSSRRGSAKTLMESSTLLLTSPNGSRTCYLLGMYVQLITTFQDLLLNRLILWISFEKLWYGNTPSLIKVTACKELEKQTTFLKPLFQPNSKPCRIAMVSAYRILGWDAASKKSNKLYFVAKLSEC